MSADIDAMPMASDAFKAVGVTTGARMRLAITDIARNRAISRRRTIPYPATANKGLEVALLHKPLTFARLILRPPSCTVRLDAENISQFTINIAAISGRMTKNIGHCGASALIQSNRRPLA